MTSDLLAALNDIGLPVGVRTLRCDGRAAQWRMARSTSKRYDIMRNVIDSVYDVNSDLMDEARIKSFFS